MDAQKQIINFVQKKQSLDVQNRQVGRRGVDRASSSDARGPATPLKKILQVTTYIAATVIAETTALAKQTPLTMQFYLLLAESPL